MAAPILNHSRYQFCGRTQDAEGRLFLGPRTPFRYRAFSDNILHTAVQGETIFSLAGFYFQQLERGAGLWWVIADFQPIPIHDPTIRLASGTTVVVPSMRTVVTYILSGTADFAREHVP